MPGQTGCSLSWLWVHGLITVPWHGIVCRAFIMSSRFSSLLLNKISTRPPPPPNPSRWTVDFESPGVLLDAVVEQMCGGPPWKYYNGPTP